MRANRLLDPEPIADLDAYRATGGLEALEAARPTPPDDIISLVTDAGLRGRGGAGFPAGVKWRTVSDNAASSAIAPTVVVNAAEGEPGTFGDRTIIRTNPFRVLEGALVAAHAVGARSVVVATKERFSVEVGRLTTARDQLEHAGVLDGVDIEIVTAASHYLLGEETGLLEAIAGRPPFPRIAPPYRHGATEMGEPSGGAAGVHMAGEGGDAPPTLVNNVETLAHVPGIVRFGAEWFRELGTDDSPGTSVFTVTGDVEKAGVGEFALGTPLREIIAELGARMRDDADVAFVLSGVANPVLGPEHLDTPATYEDMDAAGSGLGTGGFMVFSTETDPVAVAHGVSRFLAIESCGQCTPCKQDGLDVAARLDDLRAGTAGGGGGDVDHLAVLRTVLARVPEGARCDLGRQHERVVASILDRFDDVAASHLAGATAEPFLIAPISDIVDGVVQLDEDHASKQPDWEHGDDWGGQSPADRHDVAVTID